MTMPEIYERMINKVLKFMREHYIEIIIAGILSKIFDREKEE